MRGASNDGLTSITHLPDDCLCIIFQGLDCSSDRESFGLTCRHWLNIQNLSRQSLQFECSLTILNPSSLSQPRLTVNYDHLHMLLTRFQHLRHLSLSGCIELPDSGLAHLKFCGSKLNSLYLDCCFRITDIGLSLVATGCPFLTVISLYRCNITDVGLETLAGGCSSLKHINLSYCSLVSDRGLRPLAQTCLALQSINLTCCHGVTGTGLRGCSSTLTAVDAACCNIEPEGVMGIVSGGGIEYLDVSVASCSFENGLAAIGSSLAKNLKFLNLRSCRNVGDESITTIAKGCPLLQEWNVALCHRIKIPGWESIGMNCKKLEKLHVNRCRNLCDIGLQTLREGCKRLLVLYISRQCQVSTTAIELFKLYRGDVAIKEEEMMSIGPLDPLGMVPSTQPSQFIFL